MVKCVTNLMTCALLIILLCNESPAQNLGIEHAEESQNQFSQIESVLLEMYRAEDRDRPALAKRTASQYDVRITPTGKAVVILEPELEGDISQISRDDLHAIDTEILAQSKSLMRVAVPISQLLKLTQVAGVGFVRTPMRPILNRVTSEGVSNIQANRVRESGLRGAGIHVGIIDSEFGSAEEARTQGDLPQQWQYVNYTNEDIYAGDPHGTACAEIIYDIAPEAAFYLIKSEDLIDFENAKDMAIRENIDIISYSGSFFGSGFGDGSGLACDIVNDAFDNGILWITSAGNYANRLYFKTFQDFDADGWHNHSEEDEFMGLQDVAVGDEILIILIWDDFPRTSEDYDLYLGKSDWLGNIDIVERSTTYQLFSAPHERISYKVTSPLGFGESYGVAVRKTPSAAVKRVKVLSAHHRFKDIESSHGTLVTPADARGAFAVGAIRHDRYETGPQEPFSSQGPTIDGRIKPDIMGPDGVTTFSYGSETFYGTSASTPHIAGAAALLKSSHIHTFTAQSLRNTLLEATVDMGEPGRDNIYGAGRLDLFLLNIQEMVRDSIPPDQPVGTDTLSSDFDGNGTVDIPDFLLFVNHFGLSRGDSGYDERYDLDRNGVIGISDFLIFVDNFGKSVTPDEEEVAPLSRPFDLDRNNRDPQGITFANGKFYIIDDRADKIFAYNSVGQRDPASDFEVVLPNPYKSVWTEGIAFANNRFYILNDLYNEIYVFDRHGRPLPSRDFFLPNGSWSDLNHANNRLYAINWISDQVNAYTTSGDRDTDSDVPLVRNNSWPIGMAYANNRYYVIDHYDQKVYSYTRFGHHDPSSDFDLDNSNSDPSGIVYANNHFFILDENDAKVYVYDSAGKAVK